MDPFTILLFSLATLLLLIGTITDIKTREVPDYLTYGMMFAGAGLRIIYSIFTSNWSYLIEGLAGFLIFFGLACALFYGGHWGGGDSKILMAMGVLLGITFQGDTPLLSFLINLIWVGALYGLFWSVWVAVKKGKPAWKLFRKNMYEKKMVRWRIGAVVAAIILIVAAFFAKTPLALVTLAILIVLSSYLVAFMQMVEDLCLLKKIPAKQVTEGDWIAEPVMVGKKTIVAKSKTGISKKQLATLQKYIKQKKVKTVLIKEGMPFIPAFLLAWLVTLWLGNIILFFM